MKIKGKIIDILPKQTGVSRNGTKWSILEFVIHSEESTPQYPNAICFQIYGDDKINKFSYKVGDNVTVSFNINSKKYNNKYFTTISAWGVYGETTPTPKNVTDVPTGVDSTQNTTVANNYEDFPF